MNFTKEEALAQVKGGLATMEQVTEQALDINTLIKTLQELKENYSGLTKIFLKSATSTQPVVSVAIGRVSSDSIPRVILIDIGGFMDDMLNKNPHLKASYDEFEKAMERGLEEEEST